MYGKLLKESTLLHSFNLKMRKTWIDLNGKSNCSVTILRLVDKRNKCMYLGSASEPILP